MMEIIKAVFLDTELTRDLSQAEKKKMLLQADQMHKMTENLAWRSWFKYCYGNSL